MDITKTDKRHRDVLLYLDKHNGSTIDEITDGMGWMTVDSAVGIGILEDMGCVVLNFNRREDRKWEGRYFITGEGTRDYIETLKKHHSSRQPTMDEEL